MEMAPASKIRLFIPAVTGPRFRLLRHLRRDRSLTVLRTATVVVSLTAARLPSYTLPDAGERIVG